MSVRRMQKVAEAIREVVSMTILTELRDPRVQDVTVTYVEVSADLRQAKAVRRGFHSRRRPSRSYRRSEIHDLSESAAPSS